MDFLRACGAKLGMEKMQNGVQDINALFLMLVIHYYLFFFPFFSLWPLLPTLHHLIKKNWREKHKKVTALRKITKLKNHYFFFFTTSMEKKEK